MSDFNSLDEAMTAGAARAVELAGESKVLLDYSVESIEVVEQQLARLHNQIPKGFFARLIKKAPSESEIKLMSYTFGAYIAEVLKRQFGGVWSNESKLHPGQEIPTFHLGGSGGEIWPQIKVEKRLRNGEEDNVWHYFQYLKQRQAQ